MTVEELPGHIAPAAVAGFYDRIAPVYEDTYTDRWDVAEDRALSLLLRSLRPTTVVDLGSGTGHLLTLIDPADYVGVDLSKGMVEEARRRHPDRQFRHADLTDPLEREWLREWFWSRFASSPPDLVACLFTTWGYFDWLTRGALLQQAREWLRPGGHIVIVADGLWHPGMGQFGAYPPALRFTRADLAHHVRAAGFRRVHTFPLRAHQTHPWRILPDTLLSRLEGRHTIAVGRK